MLDGSEISASLLGGYGEGRLSEPPQGSNGEQPLFAQLVPPEVLAKVGDTIVLPQINFHAEVFKMKGTAQHNMIKIINSISDIYFAKIRTSVRIIVNILGYAGTAGVPPQRIYICFRF